MNTTQIFEEAFAKKVNDLLDGRGIDVEAIERDRRRLRRALRRTQVQGRRAFAAVMDRSA